jgi:hypothetical protein
MSRQQIQCQTLPEFICVKPDGFVRDVKYCDLHDPLLIEETNSKRRQAKCCYVCGVYEEKKSLIGTVA